MRQLRRGARIVAAIFAIQLYGSGLAAQTVAQAEGSVPGKPRVTDARLAAALERLLSGSARARTVVLDLAASGLDVTIGTPAGLAALPVTAGGALPDERVAPLSAPGGEAPLAWVAFRVTQNDVAERAWVVIDVDAMAARIANARSDRADALLEQDLLVALAHEFVAHVGSVARTRRLDDFCDDPTPASRAVDAMGCSIRVENQVRRELNRELRLRGPDRLPERGGYSLDVMNVARVR